MCSLIICHFVTVLAFFFLLFSPFVRVVSWPLVRAAPQASCGSLHILDKRKRSVPLHTFMVLV